MDISVGLTQFIDFTVKQTMSSKINKVKDIKRQGDYHPAKDHWKQLRDTIKYCCEREISFDHLDTLLVDIHPRKENSYKTSIKAFKKFTRNKEIKWFNPPKSHWVLPDTLLVRSTPELGLYIDGTPHLIKLFFKGDNEKVTKRNIEPILVLLNYSTRKSELPDNTVFGVLNVKSNKLHTEVSNDEQVLLSLKYEAQSYARIYQDF